MARTTRLLNQLAGLLQQPQTSQSATSAGPTTGQTVRLAAVEPPLSRSLIDDNLPAFRVMFGLLCVGYTTVTTIVGVYFDLMLGLKDVPYAPVIAAISGIVVAAAIFLIQLFCAEHYIAVYYASLIPDTWYSFKPIGWLSDRFAAVDGVRSSAEVYTALFVGVTLAFMVARFGEVLIFGSRRQARWWHFALEYLFVLIICGGMVWWLG